jgi:hypothetical protein
VLHARFFNLPDIVESHVRCFEVATSCMQHVSFLHEAHVAQAGVALSSAKLSATTTRPKERITAQGVEALPRERVANLRNSTLRQGSKF